jgi:hypothetical protein
MLKTEKQKRCYEWYEQLGEPPQAKVYGTGEIISLDKLVRGDLLIFPIKKIGKRGLINIETSKEVVSSSGTWPIYYVDSVRRAEDCTSIELVRRWQAGGNSEGKPMWTINGPNDVIEKFLNNGKGYEQADKLLKRWNL